MHENISTFLWCVCFVLQDYNFKSSLSHIECCLMGYFVPKIAQICLRDGICMLFKQTVN
jgi:hypothetical protein